MPICGTDLTVQTTMFSAYGHFPCIKQTIPKTAQSKGLFEAEIKDKNLKVSINLEVLIWRTGWDSNPRAGITDKLISSVV